ncbi:hypothetical protein Ancab_020190 [Ancistrocladus abbreviatus]
MMPKWGRASGNEGLMIVYIRLKQLWLNSCVTCGTKLIFTHWICCFYAICKKSDIWAYWKDAKVLPGM